MGWKKGRIEHYKKWLELCLKQKCFSKILGEALNTTCYTLNKVYLRLGTTMAPYEIWRCKKLNLKYFHEFGSTCFILNDREQRRKFDAKSDESIFIGYSLNSQVYNKEATQSWNLSMWWLMIMDQNLLQQGQTIKMLNSSYS